MPSASPPGPPAAARTSLRERRRRLDARRERLLIRSGLLRRQIAYDAQALQPPLALADSALAGLAWLRRNPAWPAGGLALLIVLRPRVLLRWGGRGLWAWQLWRRFRPLAERALHALDRR